MLHTVAVSWRLYKWQWSKIQLQDSRCSNRTYIIDIAKWKKPYNTPDRNTLPAATLPSIKLGGTLRYHIWARSLGYMLQFSTGKNENISFTELCKDIMILRKRHLTLPLLPPCIWTLKTCANGSLANILQYKTYRALALYVARSVKTLKNKF